MRARPTGLIYGLLAIGMAAFVAACVATTEDVKTASRQSLEKTEEVRASLQGKIEEINRIQSQAKEQQAKLEGLLKQSQHELSTAQQRGAELETRVQEIKGQDMSVLQGQLEAIRRDLDGLQSGLDDQKAQVFDANKKLAGRLDEQTAQLHLKNKSIEDHLTRVEDRVEATDKRSGESLAPIRDTIKILAKKLDETDVLLKKVEADTQTTAGRSLTTASNLAQVTETVKEVGMKLSARADQQAVTLARQEEAARQAESRVQALTAQVNEFKGLLTGFTQVLRNLENRATDVDRRVTELAGKTEGKVGALVVQEGERVAKVEALKKQLEADGQAMKTLSAKAEQQTARLDALEKTLNTVVATQNETSGSLGELKRVMEESVGRSVARPDVPPDIPAQPAKRTSIPAEPSRPAGAAPRIEPEAVLSAKDAYDRAQSQFGKGQYDIALTSFKLFLIQYPDSPLAPNAHFWMAECYFRTRDYERGIEEYEQVVKNYPKSEKASRALYRKAMAFLELNDTNAARTTLRQLIAAYPKSEDVKPAREKLAFLNK